MDVVLQTVSLTPDKESSGDLLTVPDGGVADSRQGFTLALKAAQLGDMNVVGAGEALKTLPALLAPTQPPQPEPPNEEVSEDLLRLVASVLRTWLNKTTAGNAVELSIQGEKGETVDARLEHLPEEDEPTCDEPEQDDKLSLIQRILASVLAVLQMHGHPEAALRSEARPEMGSDVHVPTDDLTALVKEIAKHLVAREQGTAGPHQSSAMNDERGTMKQILAGSQSPETDPVQRLVSGVLERVSSVGTDSGTPEPSRSGEIVARQSDLRPQKAVTPSPSQPDVPTSNPEALTRDRNDQDNGELFALLDAAGAVKEGDAASSRHNDTAGPGHEEQRNPQAGQTETQLEVSQPGTQLEVKAIEPPPSRPDRVTGEINRQPVVLEEWQPYESNSARPSIHLEVEPSDVGRVRLHVSLAGERVYANVITEQTGVRDYLLAERPRLEGGLSAQGLEMGSFQVAVEQHGHRGTDHKGPSTWAQGLIAREGSTQGLTEALPENWPDPMPRNAGREMHQLSLFA